MVWWQWALVGLAGIWLLEIIWLIGAFVIDYFKEMRRSK